MYYTHTSYYSVSRVNRNFGICAVQLQHYLRARAAGTEKLGSKKGRYDRNDRIINEKRRNAQYPDIYLTHAS